MNAKAPGILHVVATPIGNLGDFSPRAVETLRSVSAICAEDTRRTRPLLQHFGIDTALVALHEHNEDEMASRLVARLSAGESLALVSDAGTPLVSDPGFRLVHAARAAGIRVSPVPGAAALIAALSVAGLPSDRFVFEGFLPAKAAARRARLERVREESRTLIFYEAPHKLVTTLGDLLEAFGDRSVSVCRELTKLHEEIRKTTLAAALADYREGGALAPPRGEFVLVVAGAQPPAPEAWTLDAAVALAAGYAAAGQAQSAACRAAAAESGFSKSEIYRALTAQKEGDR